MPDLTPLEPDPGAHRTGGPADLGLVMTGGGARAAYQVGFLRRVARLFPDLQVPYVTGVSAGAINAAHLASHHGTFAQAVSELTDLWANLHPDDVFRTDTRSLAGNVIGWIRQLGSGGLGTSRLVRSFVDTDPLRNYLTEALHVVNGELTGVQYNLEHRALRAVALSTTSYTTGQSVTWIQGHDVELWERPHRRPQKATLTVEHVMASASLPLFFPAINIGNEWYGDGGMRLIAPLSPAVHLGARRIIAISTRYAQTKREAAEPTVSGYPPPAQVLGVMMNSIFLDLLDHDADRLTRINKLIEDAPQELRRGLKPVKLLTLRPSRDLGRMAGQFESQLPRAFRFMTRGLGTRATRSPDFLSMILFQPDYLRALIELGERDAEGRVSEIETFLTEND